jgi:hypothetical protein
MGNSFLFKTSICMFLSTAGALVFMNHSLNKFLLGLYFLGDSTSIWNHGSSSEGGGPNKVARYVDRAVMAGGACCDLYYMAHIQDTRVLGGTIICYSAAIGSYFISKTRESESSRVAFHASSHFWVTVLHTLQLYIHINPM